MPGAKPVAEMPREVALEVLRLYVNGEHLPWTQVQLAIATACAALRPPTLTDVAIGHLHDLLAHVSTASQQNALRTAIACVLAMRRSGWAAPVEDIGAHLGRQCDGETPVVLHVLLERNGRTVAVQLCPDEADRTAGVLEALATSARRADSAPTAVDRWELCRHDILRGDCTECRQDREKTE